MESRSSGKTRVDLFAFHMLDTILDSNAVRFKFAESEDAVNFR